MHITKKLWKVTLSAEGRISKDIYVVAEDVATASKDAETVVRGYEVAVVSLVGEVYIFVPEGRA